MMILITVVAMLITLTLTIKIVVNADPGFFKGFMVALLIMTFFTLMLYLFCSII